MLWFILSEYKENDFLFVVLPFRCLHLVKHNEDLAILSRYFRVQPVSPVVLITEIKLKFDFIPNLRLGSRKRSFVN